MPEQNEKTALSILLILGGGLLGYEIGVFVHSEATGSDFVLFVVAIFLIFGIFAKQNQDETDNNR